MSNADDSYKLLRAELDGVLNKDKRLEAIARKIAEGKADFKDTAKYSRIVSGHIGEVISKNIGSITAPLGKEMVCKELLKDHYERINGVLGKVQASVDEKLGIHIKPIKAPFPTERVDKAAHSLEDPTVPEETIRRRARSATENIADSMHDDYIKSNAELRDRSGMKCYIVRDAGGGCCKWCAGLEGRYDYASAPEDIFRRHDNCTCTVTYENGRQRQDVWSKRKWEANEDELRKRKELSDSSKPKVYRNGELRELSESAKSKIYKNGEMMQLENSKLKTEYPESIVIRKDIYSAEYRRQFDEFGENTNVTTVMCNQARAMLSHRTGTKFEDMAFIDSRTGKCRIQSGYNIESQVKPTKAMKAMVNTSPPNTIIAIHNHPGSTVPSIDDLVSCYKHNYKYGIVACHNGNAFRYKVTGDFNKTEVDLLLDRIQNLLYNKEKVGDKFSEKLNDALNELKKRNIGLEVFLWKQH